MFVSKIIFGDLTILNAVGYRIFLFLKKNPKNSILFP